MGVRGGGEKGGRYLLSFIVPVDSGQCSVDLVLAELSDTRNPETRTAACVFLYSGLASFPSGGIFFQLAGGSVLGMVDWIYVLWLIFVIDNWVE